MSEYLTIWLCVSNQLDTFLVSFSGFCRKFLALRNVSFIFSFKFISAMYSRLPFWKTTSNGWRLSDFRQVSIWGLEILTINGSKNFCFKLVWATTLTPYFSRNFPSDQEKRASLRRSNRLGNILGFLSGPLCTGNRVTITLELAIFSFGSKYRKDDWLVREIWFCFQPTHLPLMIALKTPSNLTKSYFRTRLSPLRYHFLYRLIHLACHRAP